MSFETIFLAFVFFAVTAWSIKTKPSKKTTSLVFFVAIVLTVLFAGFFKDLLVGLGLVAFFGAAVVISFIPPALMAIGSIAVLKAFFFRGEMSDSKKITFLGLSLVLTLGCFALWNAIARY